MSSSRNSEYIIRALEPAAKTLYSQYKAVLFWEYQDFKQEIAIKVLERPPAISPTESLIAYYRSIYNNHILDLVRRARAQKRSPDNCIVEKKEFYDDSNVFCIVNDVKEMGTTSEDIVLKLLRGRTHKQIMSEVPSLRTNYSYYKHLGEIRDKIKSFYVLAKS